MGAGTNVETFITIMKQFTMSAANHYEVYLMNLNGSNLILLTNTAEQYSSSFPTWKPIAK